MLARVSDRRREPRPADAGPDETGWVAIVPGAFGGYRILALAPGERKDTISWNVDAARAERLAAFAFTFHRTFKRKSLTARDLMTLAVGDDFGAVGVVLAMGLLA